jgi:hypothetical protein
MDKRYANDAGVYQIFIGKILSTMPSNTQIISAMKEVMVADISKKDSQD